MKALNTYLMVSLAAGLVGWWFLNRLLTAFNQAVTQMLFQMR